MNAQRRLLLLTMAAGIGVPALAFGQTGKPVVTVWKSPTCGCCKDWVTYLQRSGFKVKVNDTGNTSARTRLGIPAALGSCHTAEVAGYALEGHVPAREILRLLKDRPAAIGLAVPGMPVGSPGMDGPDYGGQRDPYKVLLVQKDGGTRVFRSYH